MWDGDTSKFLVQKTTACTSTITNMAAARIVEFILDKFCIDISYNKLFHIPNKRKLM
jgi:hypothetical protein